MMAKIAAVALAAGSMLAAAPASAQKSADTLRVYWRDQITDIDPYYNSLRTGLIVAHHAWDGLVYRDPEGFVMKPLLATAWKWIDDTTLEFELRKGVTFHNGDPFTADDVVYTVKIITDPKSGIAVPSNFTWLAGAEAVDPYRVRLKLKQPFPAALEYVSFVMPIYPMAYRERVGRDVYKREPVGAGPYRITRVDGVNQIDMERYEGYYDGSSKGRPPIKRVVIKEVTDATNEMSALLGGQADWIWQYNPDQFDSIARMPTLTALRQEAFRILHLSIDAAGRSGEKNPLTDARVRRAIFYAVDRQTFARQLVQGGARVPDAPCYFTQFGCDQSAAVHYDYDPAKAKQLLAEAGYPNGFDTEIVSANILSSWSGAVQSYLAAVGIRAKVTTLQAAAAVTRAQKGDAPLYLSSWGSYSINDVSAIIPYFFSGTPDDMARDPEVTAALKQGGSVIDPQARKTAYASAIHRITDQAYWLPISTFTTTYGISRQLNFKTFPDEMPRFFLASWK
ncbi:ABC transporter substrate-binding protein [Limobrevibacterium gyesilva]|uniref:ABC transporter substrate-binding protein n=1 Tax=Limobrevibacterium gyesilva TaxID=2991712 RepID=A0AA41YLG8_9PROT|nr:ABC transporter substrate-binding protein [Limobrevibacterium gyesilva]MCW3474442.1 ABC transporter substrate-binding protein [Limobrevibacterium gyesilva]